MKTAPKKLARCAIYTRKSTEHNLDLEFNSLDAQREACEAYIKSQAHEGWRLIEDHYDDGGLSGASLERPALQKLLSEVKAGKIDIVVVYKVDRLTRSLTDFAKLVEIFDEHKVSFVSVTQSFNTTSSMGRLTLNILLSFAQFEREVIGERVRDKIAASKRKGLWVGGPVPLGYASVNKKLIVVPQEAEAVRTIFRRYLELGSVPALADDLHRARIHSKRRVLASGRVVGGGRFGVGALAHLLRNRFYLGKVVYRGEVNPGDHEPILDRKLFEAVQAKLSANAVERKLRTRASPSLLTGRIFDDRGNRMTPVWTIKKGVRYRYYVSQAVVQRRREERGTVPRVPAAEIEALVVKALRIQADRTSGRPSRDPRELIEHYADRVIIKGDEIEICLLEDASTEPNKSISVSRFATRSPVVKGVLHAPESARLHSSDCKEKLLAAIAKARVWVTEIGTGHTTLSQIARREGNVERHIRLLAQLAFLSPRSIADIAQTSVSAHLTVTRLAQHISDCWSAQRLLIQSADSQP
jgi:DNA invertase Pin-like site-specific DNA recombinase